MMHFHPRFRRASLLGLVLVVAACDVVQFVSDPKPRLVQTWNLPASKTTISVASLLPTGVQIFSNPGTNDSSAFQIDIAAAGFQQRLGNDCQTCNSLNGTNAIKPQFTLQATRTSALPANVVSASVVSGQVTLVMTNNLSFDPLYVTTGGATPQGFLVLTMSSNTQGLVVDTIFGGPTVGATASGKLITPFAPGTQITRNYTLPTALVANSISADLVFSSPTGDHLVPINASSTVNATFSIPTLRVGSVRINVPGTTMNTGSPTELPDDIDEGITEHVIRGVLEMSITNPFAVSGTLNARFAYGPQPTQVVDKSIALPSATAAPQVRTIALDSTEMANILSGTPTSLSLTGSVTSASSILVTPKQEVSISNRLILTVRAGGGN
jgi:hypothetical protein